jgi:hypothetical protein
MDKCRAAATKHAVHGMTKRTVGMQMDLTSEQSSIWRGAQSICAFAIHRLAQRGTSGRKQRDTNEANTLTGGRRNKDAFYSIAACVYSISARGLFGIKAQAMNEANWRRAA